MINLVSVVVQQRFRWMACYFTLRSWPDFKFDTIFLCCGLSTSYFYWGRRPWISWYCRWSFLPFELWCTRYWVTLDDKWCSDRVALCPWFPRVAWTTTAWRAPLDRFSAIGAKHNLCCSSPNCESTVSLVAMRTLPFHKQTDLLL